jgi:hypothetical protein
MLFLKFLLFAMYGVLKSSAFITSTVCFIKFSVLMFVSYILIIIISSFLFYFIYLFYCCAGWVHIVALTKLLTMYHTWIQPSHCSREEGQKRNRQAVFWGDRGKGWQSREIKLKELKHEGHIALGNEIINNVTCIHKWVELCFLFL